MNLALPSSEYVLVIMLPTQDDPLCAQAVALFAEVQEKNVFKEPPGSSRVAASKTTVSSCLVYSQDL